jgi:RNA polymerase sigma-70 factor, ECF subfamily
VPNGARPAGLDFSDIYREHAGAVYRFCLSQLRDRAAAEDVAADVFASAYAAFRRANPDGAGVRPWLFRIARNATIDHQRRDRTRLRALQALRRSPGAAADVETIATTREQLRDVLSAVAHLGRRERQLLGLRVAAGLSYADIAAVMHMKENAARMATQRAVVKVRAALEDTR